MRIPLKLLNLVVCRRTGFLLSTAGSPCSFAVGTLGNSTLSVVRQCPWKTHVCTNRLFSVGKTVKDEDEITPEQMNEMLAYDTELQSLLKDITKDFDPNPPSSDPPKVRQESPLDVDFEHEPNIQDDQRLEKSNARVPLSLLGRYKQYKDDDAEIVWDVDEEQRVPEQEFYLYREKKDKFSNLNLQRGKEGVFELPELVSLLRDENLQDIVVISIPKELAYANYLVVATAKSPRHLRAVMEFLRKLHKLKKSSKDPYLQIEGEQCRDWKVLDMSNIVLHVFLPEARQRYDLETLWTVGEKYDDLSNQAPDPFCDALEAEMQFLESAQPQSVKQ